ncbi:Rieske (2Fe-2S) protein [Streptomyces sp. SID3212]|uniref:Rieske (2Fe-2S) protein n=1 Tax=Streptomyces sp. SID3212 TaxID=2690259 RepID=UPI00136B01F8|nr:Rieske (2Fe-2S) protein [Streptomyces sp. SID3212]MYV52159.1 Rieske 2Fe-2S domain-containing protein [Streptomyces sp. SID3212]
MTGTQGTARTVTRRTIVAAAGAAGLGAALVACGDDTSGTADQKPADTGAGNSGAGDVLAKTTDIPEGGGKIFDGQGVVVTQPEAGEFKAFSSKCTHQGCAVTTVKDGVINCPCHGSQFSVTDGSVKQGPATQPLPAASIKVTGDSITLA